MCSVVNPEDWIGHVPMNFVLLPDASDSADEGHDGHKMAQAIHGSVSQLYCQDIFISYQDDDKPQMFGMDFSPCNTQKKAKK